MIQNFTNIYISLNPFRPPAWENRADGSRLSARVPFQPVFAIEFAISGKPPGFLDFPRLTNGMPDEGEMHIRSPPRMKKMQPDTESQSRKIATGPLPARWVGLRARLMLFVTAALLGPLGMVGYQTYEHFKITESLIVHRAVGLATSAAGHNFGIGVPVRQLLMALSQEDEVYGGDAEDCSRVVAAVRIAEPRYAVIGAARPDGTVYCLSTEISPRDVDANVAGHEWFQDAVARRGYSKGNYFVGSVTGIRSLLFAYPVMDKGKIQTVLFAGLSLAWVSQAIQELSDFKYISAYLLGRDGLVLAQSYDWDDAIGLRMEDPRLLDALNRATDEPFAAKDLAGNERTYVLRPLKTVGNGSVYFAAGIDYAKLTADSLSRLPSHLVPLAFIAVLAYLVAWWGSELVILAPLRRLLGTIGRFGGGDLSAREGPVYAPNEFGLLGRSFDNLAEAIGRHQADLEAAAARFQGVVDNISEGIVTADERGTILTFNPAAERITGYAAKEAIGRNVAILAPEPHRSRHPEYIAAFLARGKRMAIGGPVRCQPTEAQHKNGTLVPIEMRLTEAWIEGSRVFVAAIRDVSARVKAEASEKRRAREVEALFQASPSAIVALDRDAKVIWWNPSAERIFGYSAAEVIGQLTPVVPESDFSAFWNLFGRILRGEAMRGARGVRRTKSGRRIEIEFSAAPLADEAGDAVGAVFITNDITERVQLQRQFLQAQKMEAVGQLTGGIAHDFNNLLGVLIGNLDLARERLAGNPEALNLVDTALDAGLRGAELNKRLLAFARQQALSPEIVDVNASLAGMAGLLKHSLGERVEIRLDCAAGVWPVRVDRTQLETAIVNLAVNARDAMPNGGTLTLETRNVTLDADYAARHVETNPGDYVMLAVSDTGAGMTPEVLARVFEPFFTTKEVGRGTGLGLSMVYGFLKQSGGHVTVYSEPGKGTSIRLYLPRVTEGETQAKAPAAKAEAGGTGHELVLVVEDNPDMRRIAVRQLAELGYRVAEAENADKALALLDEGPEPDLLFTDVVMPGAMDGIALAEEVAARRPGVRILLTSGFTERATVEARKRDGRPLPFALLGKPYRKDELARAVRAALENGKWIPTPRTD